jgi:hypothetical protein
MCRGVPTQRSAAAEMVDDAPDDIRVFDAGDDLDLATAGFIGHISLSARFAAVCDCANRPSCRRRY